MKNFLILLALFAGLSAEAQLYMRPKAQDYLRHTAQIIHQVHREVSRLDSTQKSGKFAMAVAHQRMARNYYEVKDYKNALYHSHYAREMVIQVYMINNRMMPPKFQSTTDEMALIVNPPSEKELHKNLLKVNPGIKFNDDDYALYEKLNKLDADDLP
jgi:HEPN domain-containing protein